LAKTGKFYWIALIPSAFMTVVVTSYILAAPEGFRAPWQPSLIAGFVLAVVLFGIFIPAIDVKKKTRCKIKIREPRKTLFFWGSLTHYFFVIRCGYFGRQQNIRA